MALAALPGHRATEFVALAGMGAAPVKSNAGKATKLPPPATELMAPPSMAATKRKVPVAGLTTSDRASERTSAACSPTAGKARGLGRAVARRRRKRERPV